MRASGEVLVRSADAPSIRAKWHGWGPPIVGVRGIYLPEDVEGLLLETPAGAAIGLRPTLALVGDDGVPLRDVWELDKRLGAEDGDPPELPRHVLTILAVEDLERATRVYRRAFGWDVAVGAPVYVEFELPDGQRIGLYQREGFANNTGELPSRIDEGRISATELYLRCDDLEPAIARLERAGARSLSAQAARPWGDEAAYFADPDGNVLVVSRQMTRGE